MAKKSKRQKWFIPVRGSYLPNSWQGWLTYLPFTAYLFFALVIGWHHARDTGQAILFIVPNWVAAAAVMTWIAKRSSSNRP
ncbi:hypothetical protein KW794_00425 [Candidatus Saccharibacteria bacterium]|nr:hypothetical protein [Candidatus Saccharibacteria bacterium]